MELLYRGDLTESFWTRRFGGNCFGKGAGHAEEEVWYGGGLLGAGHRERNCIERMSCHRKINRAIATRYDQLADSFLGMLCLASARY
jgi:hypothetical protein